MRFRLEVVHTDGANLDPPPFESQDFPDLEVPGMVLLFNAALCRTTQAAAEYLSWGRDKEGVIAGAADSADGLYKQLRISQERLEAAAEEETKVQSRRALTLFGPAQLLDPPLRKEPMQPLVAVGG